MTIMSTGRGKGYVPLINQEIAEEQKSEDIFERSVERLAPTTGQKGQLKAQKSIEQHRIVPNTSIMKLFWRKVSKAPQKNHYEFRSE